MSRMNLDLLKISKITINFELLNDRKVTINFELLNVSKMGNLRIHISPVMEKLEALDLNSRVSVIQRVLLSTPPQKKLTSLPHIYVALKNLFISSLKGYCYQIWAVKQLLDRSP